MDNGKLFKLENGELNSVSEWTNEDRAIRTIEKINDGMAIGTDDGVYLYNNVNKTFSIISGTEGMEVRAITCHKDGSLYIGSYFHGVFTFRDNKLSPISTKKDAIGDHINALYSSDNGDVWVGMSIDGVRKIKGNEIISFRDPQFNYSEIRDIFTTEDGIIWLAVVGKGIIQMIPSAITTIRQSDGLSTDISLPIYQDKRGVKWVGTAGGGVNRIENGEITHSSEKSGISKSVMLGIYGIDNYIYFCSGDGLRRYNPNIGDVDMTFTTEDGLASNIVQTAFQDSQGRAWITSRAGGVHRLHNNEKIERIPIPKAYENAEFISIMEDSKQNIWLATTTMGTLIMTPKGKMIPLQINKDPASEMVLSFYEDPEGDIWVGTDKGLLVYKDSVFHMVDQQRGLFSNGIFRIIEDDYGYLWASGNYGIQRIALDDLIEWKHNPGQNKEIPAQIFDTSDGMANRETNGAIFPAGWKMNNGEIWFPTMEGVAVVNPGEIQKTENPVDIHIESLNYSDQELDPQSDITIPPGVHSIEVRFGSFDFQKPRSISYSYRLKNLSNKWNNIGNRNDVFFTGLEPGSYDFEVQANQFGRKSRVASLSFSVKPFFYQTNLFRGLIVLSIIIFVFFVSRFYLKTKLNRELERQVQIQTKELQIRNQMLEGALSNIEKQNNILREVAWVQSHELRGPLSRLLGLVMVTTDFSKYKKINWSKDKLLKEIKVSAEEMDEILRKLNDQMEAIENNEAKGKEYTDTDIG